ncbi:hypothetical protein ACVWZ6_003334 [Bradyrhizobium sp. GM6.1]
MKRLISSAIAAVAFLIVATTMLWSYTPSAERHVTRTAIGHCKNFHSLAATKSVRTIALLSASKMRRDDVTCSRWLDATPT